MKGTTRAAIAVVIWALLAAPQLSHALASPTIVGQASTPALVGGSTTDSATLAGGVNPTGSIAFSLFISDQCFAAPIFTSTKAVNGNGTYVSDPFGPLVNNTPYSWQASYSGDINNDPVSTPLCYGTETVVVPEYCPARPCPAPTSACGGGISTTTSTTSCAGNALLITAVTVELIGPATVCFGSEKSQSCSILSGSIDFNTNTEYYGDFIFADGFE